MYDTGDLVYTILQELTITGAMDSEIDAPLHYDPCNDAKDDTVERMLERLWLDHVTTAAGRQLNPHENKKTYDDWYMDQVSYIGLMLNLDFSGAADYGDYADNDDYKTTAFIRFVQKGIDNYGVLETGYVGNWHDDSGRKFVIIFAGLALNDPCMKNVGDVVNPSGHKWNQCTVACFEEDSSVFYVDAGDVDDTTNNRTSASAEHPDCRDCPNLLSRCRP